MIPVHLYGQVAPMEEIVADFETYSSHTVNISSGSSGRLYAQILQLASAVPLRLATSQGVEIRL